ncbi:TetR/AcrR family transcriptional regulator [Streptomyces sp. NPDC058632]|uniref:TetR/AcrR family transcriptional regulator n=1 Tax=unclassified Streptomyces TaxID=2593676 RepID=UPI00365B186E
MVRARAMRADARRNHARLLEVAVEAFATYGEGASLDDIAKRAGVGSGTLYRHFPTRRALLEAAYVDRIDAIAARAGELAERLPPGEALTEWLHELGTGMIRIRGLRALLGSAVGGDGGDGGDAGPVNDTTDCCEPLKGAVARLVGTAQEAGALRRDIEPVDVLRLAHGVATASELADGEGTHIRRYLGLLTEGLRPQQP